MQMNTPMMLKQKMSKKRVTIQPVGPGVRLPDAHTQPVGMPMKMKDTSTKLKDAMQRKRRGMAY